MSKGKKKKKNVDKNNVVIGNNRKDIIKHHVIPKSRNNGRKGIKVKICSVFESTFHFLFWNMTIPEVIAFLIIVMYICKDKKWSGYNLRRLRVLIIQGHFKRETKKIEKLFSVNSNFMKKNFSDIDRYSSILPN